ncbi:MAG: phosphoenolpyruvate kinase [Deltaproteobacteria bacterium]|nr:phosphoenolpyruvate kinase [Deltaproteobacteria bacterium]
MSRAPVHVVYGGAHLFKEDTPQKLAQIAERTFAAHCKDAVALSELLGLGLDSDAAAPVYDRVAKKLATPAAVEDFRIDFEDGYGVRSPADEDHDAERAGAALRQCTTRPAFIGLRTKPFAGATRDRARRTLDLFLKAAGDTRGLTLTIPKVTHPHEVEEAAAALGDGMTLELMIESKAAIICGAGFALPDLIAAGGGRVSSVHFGAYDFLSAHDIAASEQRLDHPLCDRARELMLMTSTVRVADGATSFLPVPADDRAIVSQALWLHARNVRRALATGIYQGWDLHPAQLVARYGAVYAFFLQNKDASAERLKRFIATAAQAQVNGGVFDDAATALGLVSFFLRGFYAGAFDESDVAQTGATVAQLEQRSFAALVNAQPASA